MPTAEAGWTRKARWATCLWPGLAQLWLGGAWSGLALAFGFALLLNLVLATSLVWTELVEPDVRAGAWTAVLVFWIVSALAGCRACWKDPRIGESGGAEDLFPRALSEYLKGNWYEAQVICQQLVHHDAQDADAHLMLATLLRRTGHLDLARRRLLELGKLERAAPWETEISHELERLAELETKTPLDTQASRGESPPELLGAA